MSNPHRARGRTVTWVTGAGVVCLTVVGVGIASASSERGPGPVEPVRELRIGEIPTLESGADISLPIDEYWVPAEDQNLILRAENVAMTSCMARFGLEWNAPVVEVHAGGPSYDRLFGISNLDEVTQYGYHAPGSGPLNADGSTDDPGKEANSYDYSEEQDAVASDQTDLTEVNGVEIPPGGCITEVRSALGTHNDPVLELTERMIGYGAMQADKDPRVSRRDRSRLNTDNAHYVNSREPSRWPPPPVTVSLR